MHAHIRGVRRLPTSFVHSARFAFVGLALACQLAGAASTPEADKSFDEAKAAYSRLKNDASKRKFRHHWLNVAKKFERVATKFSKTDRAPEAWYQLGELYFSLYRFSDESDDLKASTRAYDALVQGWPTHKLVAGKGVKASAAARAAEAPAARTRPTPVATAPATKTAAPVPAPVASAVKPSPRAAPPAAPAPPTRMARALAKAAAPTVDDDDDTAVVPLDAPTREAPEASADDVDTGARTDEVDQPQTPFRIEALQEKLREVRVGQHELRPEDKEAKMMLERAARHDALADVTLAEQLGLKIRRVVIDAGHGGHDTGAIGKGGTLEKDVALAIALDVAAQLEAAGYEVILTRKDDTFVKLEDRAKIANAAKGDLFISVHCNSAPTRRLRGIETYTLNTSADKYATRLAARENAATERGVGDLQLILADLATKANTGESERLASRVQGSIVKSLTPRYKGVRDLGHKEALFFVLLGAKMPAVLVETSFLSHPDEEKLLASKDYQKDLARAIVQGVNGFVSDRGRVAQVE